MKIVRSVSDQKMALSCVVGLLRSSAVMSELEPVYAALTVETGRPKL